MYVCANTHTHLCIPIDRVNEYKTQVANDCTFISHQRGWCWVEFDWWQRQNEICFQIEFLANKVIDPRGLFVRGEVG